MPAAACSRDLSRRRRRGCRCGRGRGGRTHHASRAPFADATRPDIARPSDLTTFRFVASSATAMPATFRGTQAGARSAGTPLRAREPSPGGASRPEKGRESPLACNRVTGLGPSTPWRCHPECSASPTRSWHVGCTSLGGTVDGDPDRLREGAGRAPGLGPAVRPLRHLQVPHFPPRERLGAVLTAVGELKEEST